MELKFFYELLNSKENVGEISFRFSDDDEATERYIGYNPNSNDISRPYWAGICDVPGGRTFKSASDLMRAKIYGKKSLNQRWNDVILREIDGVWPGELNECHKDQIEKTEAKLKKKKKKNIAIVSIITAIIAIFLALIITFNGVFTRALGMVAFAPLFAGVTAFCAVVEAITNPFSESETGDIEEYPKYLENCGEVAPTMMPSKEDFGNYKNAAITYKRYEMLLTLTWSVVAVFEYDDAEYEKALGYIGEKYAILNENDYKDEEKDWKKPRDYDAKLYGYDFELLGYQYEKGRHYVCVGHKDDENVIAFVYVYDYEDDAKYNSSIDLLMAHYSKFPSKYK